ncbi:MAG: hypothetical protein RR573_02100 [Oscillospiraceae bacterium]
MKHKVIFSEIRNSLAEQGKLLSGAVAPREVVDVCCHIAKLSKLLGELKEYERWLASEDSKSDIIVPDENDGEDEYWEVI